MSADNRQPGPVLLAVLPDRTRTLPTTPTLLAEDLATRPWRLRLLHAPATGQWHHVADLTLHHDPGAGVDTSARADPIRNAPPADTTYAWTRRLREPAYRAARHSSRPV